MKKKDIVVLYIGCTIGTFAIEFARLGYQTYGIDFDPVALEKAENLAKTENVTTTFIKGDVCEWRSDLASIDIAIYFDIFEHLHDDVLGVQCCKY